MAENQDKYSRLHQDEPSTSTAVLESQSAQEHQKRPRFKYKSTLYRLGVMELVIGIVSIILTIATLVIAFQYHYYTYTFYNDWDDREEYYNYRYYHEFTFSSPGIWAGGFLLATGILGIKARSHPSVCMYKANLILSIITAAFMLPYIVLSAFAAGNNVSYYEDEYRIYSLIVIHCALAVLAFVAVVVCIVHFAYCCAGICCRRKSFGGTVLYYPQNYDVQQRYQFIQLPNQQVLLVPSPPMDPEYSLADPAFYNPTQAGVFASP